MNRRNFSKIIGLGLLAFSQNLFANMTKIETDTKYLTFKNINTDELVDVVLYQNGEYQLKGFKLVNYIMRDFREDEIVNIDPKLILKLYEALSSVGLEKKVINLHSGYRSETTNIMLSKKYEGVAKKSYHMKGEAIDFSIDGVKLSYLSKILRKTQIGGVGYYPKSRFIHLDTGNLRYWKQA